MRFKIKIENKNIIVTGGASGIGKEIVKELSKRKARVGVFDISEEMLQTLRKEFPEIYFKKCDVSNSVQVKESVNNFFAKFNKIDVLINNAALIYNSPIISFNKEGFKIHDMEMWDKVISTDLSSVFYVSTYVIEKMVLKRTKGLIINISSICSVGNAGQPGYSAAKSGVNALTTTMAKELGAFGIRVAGIAPGYVDTETTIKSVSESILKDLKSKTPLRRLGKPEEIVDSVIYIIKNNFFNGRILEVDGGLRL